MLLTRTSPFSQLEHTLEIPVTLEELAKYICGDTLIQHAFPKCDKSEREFIKTGITPEEWNVW